MATLSKKDGSMSAPVVADPRAATRPAKVSLAIIVERDGDSFYAYSPHLPGMHVDADSLEEAFRHAQAAAELYLESLVKHRDPLPNPQLGRPPKDAVVRVLTLEWPTLRMSGTR